MTLSLSAGAEALLKPKRLHTVSEIQDDWRVVPAEPGLYGWWFSQGQPPGVPTDGAAQHGEYRLLYVGIAPSGAPSKAARVRTLRDRLKNHCRGPIATSTLRRTLAALLAPDLGLAIARQHRGKVAMPPPNELALTGWMAAHARVGWAICAEPWVHEKKLIASGPRLPLNIKGSSDPFRTELRAIRILGRERDNAGA